MTRTYRLQDEDRPDYALALDEAIRTSEIRGLLEQSSLTIGQLRLRGLSAGHRIAAAADTEYRTYTSLRQQTAGSDDSRRILPLSGRGEQEEYGAGLLPVLAVLTPVLAAVAAAAFLLIGYGLALAGGRTPTADALITAGWASFGIGATTAAVGLFYLYRTAVQHTASAPRSRAARSPEVNKAREAWLQSLRDNSLLPFLRDELRKPDALPPDSGREAGPRYRSPDFSSPDFGSPDFSGPGFGSPKAPT
ncbi:hypothetical protein ACFVT1_32680 [Streptomyces sp. NPDC057963]|uniref:hypothetical protein n=1 Tax=Streptomyces sp. NPDC057963 TaxID=3346290 RepID=UPI0036E77728